MLLKKATSTDDLKTGSNGVTRGSCKALASGVLRVLLVTAVTRTSASSEVPPSSCASMPLASCASTPLAAEGLVGHGASMLQKARGVQREDRGHIALLTSGTLQRYFAESSATHFVAPLTKAGYTVDVYLSLNTEAFTPWIPGAKAFIPDPALDGLTDKESGDLLNRYVTAAGGKLQSFHWVQGYHLADAEVRFIKDSTMFNGFGVGHHAQDARESVVKHYKGLEWLWRDMLHVESTESRPYTHVVILKDDAYWMKDFDLDRLLNFGRDVSSYRPPNVYGLDCTATMDYTPTELADFVFVLDRDGMGAFGHAFTDLLDPRGSAYNTLCTERWLRMFFHNQGMKVLDVPAALIPFQRSGRMRTGPGDSQVQVCLHYACDSSGHGVPLFSPKSVLPMCPVRLVNTIEDEWRVNVSEGSRHGAQWEVDQWLY